jgi:threonine 3-dehydrogenase
MRALFGPDSVLCTDVRPASEAMLQGGQFETLDVTDQAALERLVIDNGVDAIVHMAALLSATGEQNPQLALHINNTGVTNVLECARVHGLSVFSPSTIAVFGPTTPKIAPDETVLRPTTMYGVTKVHLELLGEYYHSKFGVDFRSLRYPGVISSLAMPGGGTTDYAVEIYHEALAHGRYTSFLSEDTVLPMIYMPDLLKATTDLMCAPVECLTQRTYNVGALSFNPAELAESIAEHLPGFEIDYKPDFRQQIATTWPQVLDDHIARHDWGWAHEYDLDRMTADMLASLGPIQPEAIAQLKEATKSAAAKRKALLQFLAKAPSVKL